MHRLVLKTSSSWPKFSGGGFLGSITENMVVKDFRQPSTDSPMWRTWSYRRTMAPRRRASTQKMLVSEDIASRAVVRSKTQQFLATGSKQTPG
jgi:hypothetical protein